MAKKVDELKLALENWGQAEIMNRRPAPESPAVYLMQVRLPRCRISPPRKRLPVIMDCPEFSEVECPVKVRHIG